MLSHLTVDQLIVKLEELRRLHRYCAGWDHKVECTCGADDHNSKLNRLIFAVKNDAHICPICIDFCVCAEVDDGLPCEEHCRPNFDLRDVE